MRLSLVCFFLLSLFASNVWANLKIEWQPIPEAKGYEIRVFNSLSPTKPFFFESDSSNWTPSLPMGDYTLEVKAKKEGRQLWSDPVNFTIQRNYTHDSIGDKKLSGILSNLPEQINPAKIGAGFRNGISSFNSDEVEKNNIPTQAVSLSMEFLSRPENVFYGLGEVVFGKLSDELFVIGNISIPYKTNIHRLKLFAGPLVSLIFSPYYFATNDGTIKNNQTGNLGAGIVIGGDLFINEKFSLGSTFKFTMNPVNITKGYKGVTHSKLGLNLSWKELVGIEFTIERLKYDRDTELMSTSVGLGLSKFF